MSSDRKIHIPDRDAAALANTPVLPINSDEYRVATSPRSPAPKVALDFTSAGAPDGGWRVVRAHVREALSDLYAASLELVTDDPTLSPDALLGAACALSITRGPRLRRVCGIVRRVEGARLGSGQRLARVEVVPALWTLSQRSDCRVFQGKSAVDVVRDVLTDAGIASDALAVELTREYPAREYCVQYNETDLAFVTRLLESEGIAFYFRHDGAAEVLVLADGPSYRLCPTLDRRAVPFALPLAAVAPVETVRALASRRELRPTSVTVRDFDFTRPSARQDLTRTHPRGPNGGARALYEYPGRNVFGGYSDGTRTYTQHNGGRIAELRHLAAQATGQLASGESDVTGLMPGLVFELVGHDLPELDQRYLVTRVEHFVDAPEAMMGAGAAVLAGPEPERYRNVFEGILATVPFVPSAVTPRPIVFGAQTATVVGPAGEEVFVDPHGRIKVQFHWDRAGKLNETSSAFVRVAQTWAGAGFGMVFTPRVGMEVVVHFLEGDPDRPMVTGCVYNSEQPPPIALPAEKTRTTFRTRSSAGGTGFNELSFDDLAGAEEVRLHAGRDLHETVKNDHTLSVDGSQSESVGGSRTRAVGGNETVTVEGMLLTTAKGGFSLRSPSDSAVFSEAHLRTQGGTGLLLAAGRAATGNSSIRMVPTEITAAASDQVRLGVGPEKDPVSKVVIDTYSVTAKAENWVNLEVGETVLNVQKHQVNLTCGTAKLTMNPDAFTLEFGANKITLAASGIALHTNGLAPSSLVTIDGKPFGAHMHPTTAPGKPTEGVMP